MGLNYTITKNRASYTLEIFRIVFSFLNILVIIAFIIYFIMFFHFSSFLLPVVQKFRKK